MFRISNKKNSSQIYNLFIYSGLIFAAVAIILVAIDNMHALIAWGSIFLIYMIILMIIKPGYFDCEIENDRITLKFYPIATVSRDYKSFEFHPSRLVDYKIQHSYLGLRKQLIITVNMQKGPADYPPISVSSLKKEQLIKLQGQFDQFLEGK